MSDSAIARPGPAVRLAAGLIGAACWAGAAALLTADAAAWYSAPAASLGCGLAIGFVCVISAPALDRRAVPLIAGAWLLDGLMLPRPLAALDVMLVALLAFLSTGLIVRWFGLPVGWRRFAGMTALWALGSAVFALAAWLARSATAWLLAAVASGALAGAIIPWGLGHLTRSAQHRRLPLIWTPHSMKVFIDTSPIIRRIGRRSAAASTASRLGIVVGLGMLAALSIVVLSFSSGAVNVWGVGCAAAVMMIPLSAIFLPPLVASAVAATLTGVDIREAGFDLLRLTHLTAPEVSWAYAIAALRGLGSLLSYQFAMLGLAAVFLLCPYFTLFPLWGYDVRSAALPLGALAGVGALLGLDVFGAAVGYRLALFRQRDVEPSILAPLLVLIAALALLGGLVLALGMLTTVSPQRGVVLLVLLALAPYAIAADLLDNAHL